MASRDGFFTVFPDDEVGTIWLQIENWNEDFLYASGLSSGLGSNPIGLDRGQWGETRVVRFKRVGRRVYLIERNLRYRAITTNPVERRAVEESFADSVIWATDIVARTGDQCLVDAKSLLIRDAHRVVNTLKSAEQGDFQLDRDRSFVSIDRCRAFPRNTELEATLTFASDEPGALVRQTAAEGGAFSLRLHHSLVKLPDAGYQRRLADPRVGVNHITFANFSAPLDAPLTQRNTQLRKIGRLVPSDGISTGSRHAANHPMTPRID